MSQQIDPRLYSSGAPPNYHQPQQQHPAGHPPPPPSLPHHHYDSSARLPRIDQTHQLPPLSGGTPLSQPYYRLPPTDATQGAPSLPPPHHRDDDDGEDIYEQSRDPYGQYGSEPSPNDRPNADPNDPKRPRACEACRGLKVRCDRDESQPNKPCKRCWKAKRNCVVTAPSRKRQKKTDSRVAELEKKIDALTKSLHAKEGQLSPPQSTYSASTNIETPPTRNGSTSLWQRNLEDRTASQSRGGLQHSREPSTERSKRRHIEKPKENEMLYPPQRPRSSRTDDSDSVSSGQLSVDMSNVDHIVDPETASRVFDRYVAEMARHLPAVTFEENTTAAEIRASRPVLFLAILDAASVGMLEGHIQLRLNKMLLDVFASSIIRNGEKSLDLIQALMVSTIWYRPPARFEAMNVYLLTHMSALMALDFGMGKKLNVTQSWRIATRVGQAQRPQTFLNSDSVEARRTWLGCYFQCMTVSLSMRRPNFIRWNSHLEECVKLLESAPEALPSDKRLCQHIKLMHINEEVGQRFSMDDPSASIVITDPRVQFAILGFEERLDAWCASIPRDMWNSTLVFSSYFCRLYIHEVALHNNHNVDDFRAPFTEESLKTPSLQARHLSPYHSGLLKQCLTAVHGMIDTFISFDKITVKAMPIFYFVRVAYAVVVLVKLHYAISVPNANLMLKESDLQVELYLDRLFQVFQEIAEEEAFRPAKKFMLIVGKLRDGFHKDKGLKKQPSSDSAKSEQDRDLQTRQQLETTQAYQPQGSSAPHYGEPMAAPNYSQAQTPLHFLSEVATNDSARQDMHQSMPQQSQAPLMQDGQQAHASHWYQEQAAGHNHMMLSGMDYPTSSSMDPGFEQAVDLTMGIGEGDLSSLFMEDSNIYGFGAPGLGAESVAMGLYGAEGGW